MQPHANRAACDGLHLLVCDCVSLQAGLNRNEGHRQLGAGAGEAFSFKALRAQPPPTTTMQATLSTMTGAADRVQHELSGMEQGSSAICDTAAADLTVAGAEEVPEEEAEFHHRHGTWKTCVVHIIVAVIGAAPPPSRVSAADSASGAELIPPHITHVTRD